jgi:UMF1 family MFS transporter
MLFFVRPGFVVPAMVLFIFSNIGYAMGEIFVSSFLPDIAGEERIGRVSGFAWAFGYIGGLLSLVLCLLVLTKLTGFGKEDLPVRLTNLVTALFFGAAAIPTFLYVRERGEKKSLSTGTGFVGVGFSRLASTFRHIRQFRELMKILVSFLMFHSGIAVVIAFAAIFAQKELGFTPAQTVVLVITVNIAGVPGGFGFGLISDSLGRRNSLLITLLIWIAAVTSAFFITNRTQFWIVAILVGIAMGSSLSVARALVGVFAPRSKSAEFFSFWGFAVNFSRILGILTFGVLSFLFESNRLAILSTIVFFIAGIVILLFVNEDRGQRAALAYGEG